jgi:hypothetical protein
MRKYKLEVYNSELIAMFLFVMVVIFAGVIAILVPFLQW